MKEPYSESPEYGSFTTLSKQSGFSKGVLFEKPEKHLYL